MMRRIGLSFLPALCLISALCFTSAVRAQPAIPHAACTARIGDASSPSHAPAAFTHPMQQGTLLHYALHTPGSADTSAVVSWVNTRIFTLPMTENYPTGALTKHAQIDGFPNFLPARITTRGTVELLGYLPAGRIRQIEYYPSDPPANDTISLPDRIRASGGAFDSVVSVSLARTLRTFDTTVLGVPSRAFTCSIARPAGTDVVTVADGWGLIREERASGVRLELSAAIIDDVAYNSGNPALRFIPLAIGNTWQYDVRIEFPWKPDSTLRSVETQRIIADTSVGTVRYAVRTPPGTSDRQLFREVGAGLFEYILGMEILRIPGGGTRDAAGYGLMILGTGTETVLGRTTATCTVARWYPSVVIVSGATLQQVYGDGIGMIRSVEVGVSDPVTITKTLRYARIDGVEYGTPAGAPSAPAGTAAGLTIDAQWPHPLSGSSDALVGFSVATPMPVLLTVRDMLGRAVFTRAIDAAASGAQLARIPAGTLVPGSYLCDLRAGDLHAARVLIVLK